MPPELVDPVRELHDVALELACHYGLLRLSPAASAPPETAIERYASQSPRRVYRV